MAAATVAYHYQVIADALRDALPGRRAAHVNSKRSGDSNPISGTAAAAVANGHQVLARALNDAVPGGWRHN